MAQNCMPIFGPPIYGAIGSLQYFADCRFATGYIHPPASVPKTEAGSAPAGPVSCPPDRAGAAAAHFMDDGGISSILAANARGER